MVNLAAVPSRLLCFICSQGNMSGLWRHHPEGGPAEAFFIFKPGLERSGRSCGPGRRRLLRGRAGPELQGPLLRAVWGHTEARGYIFWRHSEQSDCAVRARKTGGGGRGAGRRVISACIENRPTLDLKPCLALQFLAFKCPPFVALQVYSGYRFLLAASDRKIPIAILNIGSTRADHLAELKVRGRCGEVLTVIQPLWVISTLLSEEATSDVSKWSSGWDQDWLEGEKLLYCHHFTGCCCWKHKNSLKSNICVTGRLKLFKFVLHPQTLFRVLYRCGFKIKHWHTERWVQKQTVCKLQ